MLQTMLKSVETPQALVNDRMVDAPLQEHRQVPAARIVRNVVEVPQDKFGDRITEGVDLAPFWMSAAIAGLLTETSASAAPILSSARAPSTVSILETAPPALRNDTPRWLWARQFPSHMS